MRVNGKHCRLQLLQATSPSRPLVPTPVNATDDAGWSSDTENSTLPVEVPHVAMHYATMHNAIMSAPQMPELFNGVLRPAFRRVRTV